MTVAALTKATLTIGKSRNNPGTTIEAHFNPASLRVTTTNQFKDDHPEQIAKPTSFKLDVELLFDSTDSGFDIFETTKPIRDAASATGTGATASNSQQSSARTEKAAKLSASLDSVELTWGTTTYTGYIESLNETLDYWSSDGVPLRSTMQISIKGKIDTFLCGTFVPMLHMNEVAPSYPEVVPVYDSPANEKTLINIAKAMGAASSARGVAALNGLESMRGGTGASAGASAGAFAGAGAGASAGASASAGARASAGAGAMVAAGAGAQLQAAAGFQMSGGVSAGASAGFGMGASAGLSAGAGLGASVGVGMAAGAGFGMGGGISGGAGAGFGASAGVGASAGFGASASFGASAGAGFSSASGASFGTSTAFGTTSFAGTTTSSSGGFSMTTSTSVTGFDGSTRSSTTTTTTGFDGVTRTTSSSQTSVSGAWGSASVGIPASAGAFAGLGASRMTLPGAGFNPDLLLPPPAPIGGTNTFYDVSGRAVSGNGQVAASYSARAGVTVW